MNVVCIIQARMGSDRLPGKVMMEIAGKPMLEWVLRRVNRGKSLNRIVVATTNDPRDDVIESFCRERGQAVFRGAELDVLDRFHRAASANLADVVVRITSDCPFIDSDILDRVVSEITSSKSLDYASNTLPPRTFPRGLDVEVFKAAVLAEAWHEDDDPRTREHVTPFIREHPTRFRLQAIQADGDFSRWRWTVDTREDLEAIRLIAGHLGSDDPGWRTVLAVCEKHPELHSINSHIIQKGVRQGKPAEGC